MKNLVLILFISLSLLSLSLSAEPWDLYDIYILSVQWGSTLCLTGGKTCYEKMKVIPRHSMSIHGLWPSVSSGAYLADCNSGEEISIIDNGSDTFLKMRKYWPSLTSSTNQYFWNHEYNKHGYCYLKKLKLDEKNYEIYFAKVFELFFKYKINTLMIDLAGDAEDGEYVLPDDFIEKMDDKFGKNTYSLKCTKNGGLYYLSEIRFKLNMDFKLTDKPKSQNSCPNGKAIHVNYVS